MGTPTDSDRFEDLYRETFPRLIAYCRRRLPASDVEGAVSEIYTIAWQKRDQLLTADEPMAWLYGVGFRVISNQYRATRRSRSLHLKLGSEPSPEAPDVSDEVGQHTELDRATLALRNLSVEDQELIRLAAFEELTAPEIAAVLGISPGAARSRLHRARQRLRKTFESGGNA